MKISEGSWVPRGHDDILTRALGKEEHGGYVRGVRGGLCLRDVFGSQKNSQISGVVSTDDLAKISKRVREEYKKEMSEMQVKHNQEISEMHTKLEVIMDHFKEMGMPFPNNYRFELSTPPKELMPSSFQSVDLNPPDPFLDI